MDLNWPMGGAICASGFEELIVEPKLQELMVEPKVRYDTYEAPWSLLLFSDEDQCVWCLKSGHKVASSGLEFVCSHRLGCAHAWPSVRVSWSR